MLTAWQCCGCLCPLPQIHQLQTVRPPVIVHGHMLSESTLLLHTRARLLQTLQTLPACIITQQDDPATTASPCARLSSAHALPVWHAQALTPGSRGEAAAQHHPGAGKVSNSIHTLQTANLSAKTLPWRRGRAHQHAIVRHVWQDAGVDAIVLCSLPHSLLIQNEIAVAPHHHHWGQARPSIRQGHLLAHRPDIHHRDGGGVQVQQMAVPVRMRAGLLDMRWLQRLRQHWGMATAGGVCRLRLVALPKQEGLKAGQKCPQKQTW